MPRATPAATLQWPGKRPYEPQAPTSPALHTIIGPAEPADAFYLGDNLGVLEALRNRHEGQIQLAYADPPFATNLVFTQKLRLRGETAKRKSLFYKETRYHDRWTQPEYLQFIYDRLSALHPLLADTGALFLHADWRSTAALKILADEIFGADNFRNEIIWFYPSGGDAQKCFNRKHDTILLYGKSDAMFFDWQAVLIPYSAAQRARFAETDEHGHYYWNVNPRGEPVKTRLRKDGIARYDVMTVPITARTDYPTAKPPELLEIFIKACSRPGDTVLDVFAGSGNFAATALALGRRFIAVDNQPAALHALTERIFHENEPLPPLAVWNAGAVPRATRLKKARLTAPKDKRSSAPAATWDLKISSQVQAVGERCGASNPKPQQAAKQIFAGHVEFGVFRVSAAAAPLDPCLQIPRPFPLPPGFPGDETPWLRIIDVADGWHEGPMAAHGGPGAAKTTGS